MIKITGIAMSEDPSKATQFVNGDNAKGIKGEAFMQGPTFASTFHHSGDVNNEYFQYARFHNPTWSALENKIAQLEEGNVLIFPSGMAAAVAVMTPFVESGDTILLPSDGYYASRAYAENYLQKFGVKVRTIPTRQLLEVDYTDVKLVFIETPSNPMLDVVDIVQLSEKVHKAGGLLAVDNSTLTPLGQKPLSLGADLTICSDTKAMNGHSDVVFGHVATQNEQLYTAIADWRKFTGNIPGPMETWLVHRGLTTLDLRLERMVNNAMTLAPILEQHDRVVSVRYPGLPNDPSFKIASTQMSNFGFIISFDLGSKEIAEEFLKNSKLIFEATSFGGIHTMAERRARWGDDVPEGLIRLSVGCEQINDIQKDILNSLG